MTLRVFCCASVVSVLSVDPTFVGGVLPANCGGAIVGVSGKGVVVSGREVPILVTTRREGSLGEVGLSESSLVDVCGRLVGVSDWSVVFVVVLLVLVIAGRVMVLWGCRRTAGAFVGSKTAEVLAGEVEARAATAVEGDRVGVAARRVRNNARIVDLAEVVEGCAVVVGLSGSLVGRDLLAFFRSIARRLRPPGRRILDGVASVSAEETGVVERSLDAVVVGGRPVGLARCEASANGIDR